MHFVIFILVILLLVWFMFPAQKPQKLSTEESYRNEPSRIQMDNAEFKFYT
jgi:preprotein translocase subunit YajC